MWCTKVAFVLFTPDPIATLDDRSSLDFARWSELLKQRRQVSSIEKIININQEMWSFKNRKIMLISDKIPNLTCLFESDQIKLGIEVNVLL